MDITWSGVDAGRNGGAWLIPTQTVGYPVRRVEGCGGAVDGGGCERMGRKSRRGLTGLEMGVRRGYARLGCQNSQKSRLDGGGM